MSRNSPVRSVPVELLGGVLLGALQDEAVTLGKGERTAGKKDKICVTSVVSVLSYTTNPHTHLPVSAQQ